MTELALYKRRWSWLSASEIVRIVSHDDIVLLSESIPE